MLTKVNDISGRLSRIPVPHQSKTGLFPVQAIIKTRHRRDRSIAVKRTLLNALFLTATVLVVLFSGLRFADQVASAGRMVGLVAQETGAGVEIERVVTGLPADRAGIESGDRLVRVDDAEIETIQDFFDATDLLEQGRTIPIVVERLGRTASFDVTPGTTVGWGKIALEILAIIGYLSIATLARFRAPPILAARLLSAFSILVALELSLPNVIAWCPYWSLLRELLFFNLTGFQIGLELHLFSVIPKRYPWYTRRPWLAPTYYAAGIAAGLLTSLLWISDTFRWSITAQWGFSAIFVLNNIILVAWGCSALAILVLQYTKSHTPGHRSQALLILISILIWTVFNIGTTIAMSIFGIEMGSWLDYVQPIVLIFYPCMLFVAIFRFHLFDIKLVIRRSLILALVTTGILGLVTVIFERLVSHFGRMTEIGNPHVFGVGFVMLLVGILFNPARRMAQRWIDKRFYPDRIAQRERLAELAANLPSLGSLTAIGKHVVEEVSRVFNLKNATLLVADPSSGLLVSLATASDEPLGDGDISLLLESDDRGIDMLRKATWPLPADLISATSPALAQRIDAMHAHSGMALISGNQLVGLLLIGAKREPGALTNDEAALLRLFCLNVATVLENVRLFQSATYEQLTGLLRREAILKALEIEVERAVRYHRPLTVGMLDLDRFKDVNDTWGHLAGDAVLQKVGTELQRCLRTTDQIGRYGGEEFLFFLPETSLEEGRRVAEKLRHAVESLPSPVGGAPNLKVTATVGVTEVPPGTDVAPSTEELITVADRALLRGKRLGRNQVLIADDVS